LNRSKVLLANRIEKSQIVVSIKDIIANTWLWISVRKNLQNRNEINWQV